MQAKPGSFHLLPQDERLPDLRRDYQSMGVMLFGEASFFDDILNRLASLGEEINEWHSRIARITAAKRALCGAV